MNETIQLDQISKWLGKKQVLQNISFTVAKGDIFGYLGPNGAGKTTTMRIILGLLNPDSGTVLVQGKNLARDTEAHGKVGVLLDRDGLYERLSAYDNLQYYARLYAVNKPNKRIDELLGMMGLSQRKHDKVGTYSKGMKRKLALAKAIINQPDVLFLDEPTASLDPEAQKMVRDLLLQLCQKNNMTIFLNSHDLDEVQRICSQAAIIQNGIIRVCDRMANITGKDKPDILEIKLADQAETTRAVQLLNTIDAVSHIDQKEPGQLVVTLAKFSKPSDLLTALVGKDIKVEEIKAVRQSLEDIYLEIMHQEKTYA